MTSRRGGTKATPAAICKAIVGLIGAAACEVGPSPRGPRNRQQFAKLRESNRMRLMYEQRTGHAFAWIVRARLDMLLLATVPLPTVPRRQATFWGLATLHRATSPHRATSSHRSRARGGCASHCLHTGPRDRGFYLADHIFILNRLGSAALESLPDKMDSYPRELATRPHGAHSTAPRVDPNAHAEWQLFSHLSERRVTVRLLPLSNASSLLSFDSWRFPGTVQSLREAELATSCAVLNGCDEVAIKPVDVPSVPLIPEATTVRLLLAQRVRGIGGG